MMNNCLLIIFQQALNKKNARGRRAFDIYDLKLLQLLK